MGAVPRLEHLFSEWPENSRRRNGRSVLIQLAILFALFSFARPSYAQVSSNNSGVNRRGRESADFQSAFEAQNQERDAHRHTELADQLRQLRALLGHLHRCAAFSGTGALAVSLGMA
jgi:hypothetical protein